MSTNLSRREMLLTGAGGLLAAVPTAQSNAAQSQTRDTTGPFARVEPLIGTLLARSRTPGLSIAIIQKDAIVFARGFGLANVASNTPLTTKTIFQAASLTKPLFAYAVLKQCELGRIGLDTPLVEHIPHASVSRDPRAHRITPRMVLAHTSGLPKFGIKRPLHLDFDPGAHFAYSGVAFDVLQEVVEKRCEQPLNPLLTKSIIVPFGMTESAFAWNPAFESSAAIGYEWDGTPVKETNKPAEAVASSSLHTTASDYANFMIASTGHGQRADERLGYTTERIMLSPQVRLSGPLAWGLGWALLLRDDGDIHWHFGDSRGYMSYAAMCRATGDGIVIFTNGRHGLRLCHAVAREVLEDQDTIFSWIYDVFYEGKLPQWPAA